MGNYKSYLEIWLSIHVSVVKIDLLFCVPCLIKKRYLFFTHPVKYDFSKLNDSGNCIIRNTYCIVFDLKRNVS